MIVSYILLIKSMLKSMTLLVLLLLPFLALPQILAIDFGTQYIKGAIVHSGAGKSFSIVQNHKSQRKFNNAIAFLKEERFYQTQALYKRNRFPTNSFVFYRLLLDASNDPSTLTNIKKDLFLEYINASQNDQIMAKFILQNFPPESNSISLLDIFAMVLKHVKLQTQIIAKTGVKDCVIAIPSHWTLRMRSFILSAAQVADLYVISLISQNTAAAINYALNQRTTNQTQTIMFYNLGANSLQISLVKFQHISYEKSAKPIESIFVLGDYGKSYVGGVRFNQILANYFAQKFNEKYKRELSLRGKIKLLQQSNKIKQILSSNKEATIIVEGIMDGIDFQQKITRQHFQHLCQPLFNQLISPIKRFLLDNNFKTSEITTVELIGGSVRLPKLQSLLSQTLGKQADVGTRINGDQSMALGSAFFAANSSKKFKVKGMHLYDGFNFEIRAVITNLDTTIQQGDQGYIYKNVTVFKSKSRFGLSKEINFRCQENILIELYKQCQDGLELLKSVQLNKIKQINETDYKVSITIVIDPINVVTVKQTKLLYRREQIETYTEKVKKNIPVQNQTESTQSLNQTASQNNNQTNNQTKKNKTKKLKEQYQTVQRNRTVTKKYQKQLERNDVFTRSPTLISKQEVEKSRNLLRKYESREEEKRKLAESKNKLQAIIYEVRDRLQNSQFLQFCKESEIENLDKQIQTQSAWLNENDVSNIENFREHYENINQPLSKIKKRISQYNERETIKKQALNTIQQYANLTKKLQKQKSWIKDEQISSLEDLIQSQIQQVNSIYNVMIQKKKNQDLVYRNKDLIKNAQVVKERYFSIKATPKPKQSKKEQQKDQESQEEEENKENEQENNENKENEEENKENKEEGKDEDKNQKQFDSDL